MIGQGGRRAARVLLAAALLTGVAAGPLLTASPAAAAPSATPSSPSNPSTPATPKAKTNSLVQPPTLLLVDTSGSMGDQDPTGTVKIEGAKTAILELLQHMPLNSRLGLRTYPAGGASCGTGHLDIPIAQRDPATMSASIRALRATGDTPTAEALRQAGKDLKAAGYDSATIILVSDGQSTCDKPCPVAQELAAEGLAVTVRAMGFQIEQAGEDELKCLAAATGGSYTDVKDAGSLGTQLAALAGPALTLHTTVPTRFSSASQTTLDVSATIENTASVEATDVRASLVFDPTQAGGALVNRPLAVLGNAAGGSTLRVAWTAYPSRTVESGTLRWTISVTSRGSPPVTATGSIQVRNDLTLDDASPVFKNARNVVVLGDSYSSGEGAHDYVASAGGCHRSRKQYAFDIWTDPAKTTVTNLACSGAVAADFIGHQPGRDMFGAPWPSQFDQLSELSTDPDLVLLTTGGNDINFASIITNCLSSSNCSGGTAVAACAAAGLDAAGLLCAEKLAVPGLRANPAFWTAQLASLHTTLVRYYKEVLDSTGTAPVVVLPYVEVVPNTARGSFATGCIGALPGVSTDEFAMIRWLEAELDNTIASAVTDVQKANVHGSSRRLYFAGDVQTALEPDHTLCANRDQRSVVGIDMVAAGYGKQELVHPTADGYKAIAEALVRWSTTMRPPSVSAQQAQPLSVGESLLKTGVNGAQRAGSAVQSGLDTAGEWVLDQFRSAGKAVLSSPATRIVASMPVSVSAGGFTPGDSVVVGIGSTLQTLAVATADARGNVAATVDLPPGLQPGAHVLFAAGFTPTGDYRVQWAPTTVQGPGLLAPLVLTGLGLLATAAGAMRIRRWRRA